MKRTVSSCVQGRGESTPPKRRKSTMVAVHHRQARVAAGDDLARLDPEQLGEELAQLGEALESAVVAHVDPGAVLRRGRQAQEVVGEVELRGGRLAPRQVEPETAGLQGRVGFTLLGEEAGQVVVGQGREGGARVRHLSILPLRRPGGAAESVCRVARSPPRARQVPGGCLVGAAWVTEESRGRGFGSVRVGAHPSRMIVPRTASLAMLTHAVPPWTPNVPGEGQ